MTQNFTKAPTQRAALLQKAQPTPFCLISKQFTNFSGFPVEAFRHKGLFFFFFLLFFYLNLMRYDEFLGGQFDFQTVGGEIEKGTN